MPLKKEKTEFECWYEDYLDGRKIDAEIMLRAMAQALYELLQKEKHHEKKDKRLRRVRSGSSVSRKRSQA
jgi:hypothetical protein